MNKTEIKDFKNFLSERNILLMFSTNYRQNRLTVNPATLDEYLEKARVENVIPQEPKKLNLTSWRVSDWKSSMSNQGPVMLGCRRTLVH